MELVTDSDAKYALVFTALLVAIEKGVSQAELHHLVDTAFYRKDDAKQITERQRVS